MSNILYCQLSKQCNIWNKQHGIWTVRTCKFSKSECNSIERVGIWRNAFCPFSKEKVYSLLVDNFTDDPIEQ